MERKHSLSVIIIVRDEADRIRDCLESVSDVADEIVVVDSGSTDDTVAICREYTSTVVETDWAGDGIQKQRALERATCEWVFRIDADERMSPELRHELQELLERDTIAESAFEVRWATWFFGRYLTHGEAGVAHINLFRREGARYGDRVRHAPLFTAAGPTGTLRGRLLHDSWRDMEHLLAKLDDYSLATAEQDYAAGKRGGPLRASVHGLGRFWQAYIYRRGFLDGARGLMLAILYGQYAFNKYVALWALEQAPPGADELQCSPAPDGSRGSSGRDEPSSAPRPRTETSADTD